MVGNKQNILSLESACQEGRLSEGRRGDLGVPVWLASVPALHSDARDHLHCVTQQWLVTLCLFCCWFSSAFTQKDGLVLCCPSPVRMKMRAPWGQEPYFIYPVFPAPGTVQCLAHSRHPVKTVERVNESLSFTVEDKVRQKPRALLPADFSAPFWWRPNLPLAWLVFASV